MPLLALVFGPQVFDDAIASLEALKESEEKAVLVMPRSSRPPPNGEIDVLPTFGSWMSGGAAGDDDAGEDDEEEEAEEEVESRPNGPTSLSKGDSLSRSRLAPSDDDVCVRTPKSSNSWTDQGVSSTFLGIDAEKARAIIVCISSSCWCMAGRSSFEYNWRSEDLPVPPHTLLSSSWTEKR